MGKLKFRFNVAGLVFLLLFCISPIAWAEEIEPKKELPKEGSKARKEIFVDKVISPNELFWCGNNALVFYKRDGLFIYEVESGRKVLVGDVYLSPLGCSPDGEWLVYEDKSISRFEDENIKQRNLFLWRYELKTGKREKFLIADDVYAPSVNGAIFAPDGNTIYLANKPTATMEMPEPKWEVVWLERNTIGKVWLTNPMALVGLGKSMSHSGPMMEIDVLSPYKKKIELDSGFNHPSLIMTDVQDRVYMIDRGPIVRCSVDLDKEDISCGSLFFGDLISEGFSSYSGFDIPDDVNFAVIAQGGDSCVRLRRIGESGGRCVTTTDHKIGSYVRISPDGKWLAYETFDGLYITEFTIN